jgi:hypothetical protein
MKLALKRNKPLLFLPLVMIPFIVLIFYILGGGKNPKEQSPDRQDTIRGANYNLPEADRSIQIIDKTEGSLSPDEITLTRDYNILGESAEIKADSMPEGLGSYQTYEKIVTDNESSGITAESNTTDPDQLLKHIQRRQLQIRSELETGKAREPGFRSTASNPGLTKGSEPDKETKVKTERPGSPVTETGIEELDQVFRQNAYLTKLNDSLSFQLKQANANRQNPEEENSRRAALENAGQSAFKPKEQPGSMLRAEVYETTTVLTGNRLKLRLLEDGWLNEVKIPEGTFLYGTCEVANERLQITIRQIPVREHFIPVDITIYDLDGLAGLYVPDNAARKVSKEAGSSVNTSSMFGVAGNPLTYAGIQAADRTAQSLLRTIRIKRVTVKKNTLVWLINKPK